MYRFKITIDKTKVSGTNTNFVYLFSEGCSSIPSGFWSHVTDTSTGLDIRFFDSDGVTELKREIVVYTPGSSKVEAWVQLSSLSTSVNKTIYCQYGGPTRASDTSIWTDAGYKAVYHLQGNANDSAYGNTGTINGATVNTSGKIDSAYDFDGASKKITVTNTANIVADNNSYVMSAWVYLANSVQNAGILSKWTGSGNFPQETLSITGNDSRLAGSGKKIGMLLRVDNTTERGAYTNSDYATGSWRYVVGVADKVADTIKIYVDGAPVAITVDHNSGSWPNVGNTDDLTIGTSGSLYLNGTIDEARISKTAPGDDWVLTEYNNQNSPSTFSYAGSEEDVTRIYRFPITIDKTKVTSPSGSTVFTDETGKIWTPTSNVALSNSKYKFGPTSGYFSGSFGAGGMISTPDSADWIWGTNDFTAECWINTTDSGSGGGHGLFYNGEPGNTQASASLICFHYSGVIYFRCIPSNITDIISTTIVNDGNWHHIACVRYSGTFYLYIDGVSEGTPVTQTVNFGDTGYRMGVGGTYGNGSYNFNGYIDELRISNGVARYTSNFTPPTSPFTVDSYTKALLHFGTYLSNFTYLFSEGCANIPASLWSGITSVSGLDLRFFDTDSVTELKREVVCFDALSKKVEAWVQIPSLTTDVNKVIYCVYGGATRTSDTTVWTDLNAKEIWHFQNSYNGALNLVNGTNYGATDTVGKVERGLALNGSAYVDMGANITFASGDNFTISSWVKTSVSGFSEITRRGLSSSGAVYLLDVTDTGMVRIYIKDTSGNAIGVSGSTNITDGNWHHVVGVRDALADKLYIYVDGIENSGGGITDTTTAGFDTFASNINIGRNPYPAEYFTGSLDEIRIIKTALSAAWVATEYANQNAPATFSICGVIEDVTRVYRLPIYIDKTKVTSLNNSTEFIDSVGKVWTATNAILKTDKYRYAPASGYFNGSAYIQTPDSADFAFGTGDYTIDFWINTAASSGNIVYQGESSGTPSTVLGLFNLSGGNFTWIPNFSTYPTYNSLASLNSLNDNQWHHIACVRYGNIFTLYVDGTYQASVTLTYTAIDSGYPLYLGSQSTLGSGLYTGYIDEFRVSKGIARWTSDFSPSSTKYTIDSYTKVLLHFGDYLTNYPYLFNEGCRGIPDSFWAHSTNTNNLDLRFYDTNGIDELKREIVTYDSINKKVEAWVQIPSLGADNNKQIWCIYGSTTRGSDISIWSDINTTAVYHFQGNANDALTLNNGTVTGAVQVDGKVSKAYQFNGSSDKIVLNNNIDFSGDITVAAWINLSALPANGGDYASDYCSIVSRASWCSATVRGWEPFAFGVTSAGKLRLNCFYTTACSTGFSGDAYETSSALISTSTWYHVAVTSSPHSSTSRVVKFYLNGALQASTQTQTQSTTFYQDSSMQTQIGSSLVAGGTTKRNLAGIIDDLRIYNTTILTADQIGTLAANQGSPSTFSACGPESNTGESVTVLMFM